MKTSIARREFLRRTALTFGSLSAGSVLFESVLGSLMTKAMAQTGGGVTAPNSNYVHLSFPGAPPRWLFDLPLTPMGNPDSSNFNAGSFGTLYEKSGANWAPKYVVEPVTVGGKTLYLPPVWQMNLANQNFSSILQNTLFVRGMNMQINSHQLSNELQVSPILGGYSLTGVTADKSTLPVPGIADGSVPASSAFRSTKGLAATAINYASNSVTNPAMALLQPFNNVLAGSQFNSPEFVPLQQQALQEFEHYSQNAGFTSSVLGQMYDNAIGLMESNLFNTLTAKWASMMQKYQGIVAEGLTTLNYAGLNDKPILATTDQAYNVYTSGATQLHFDTGFDIRNLITSTTMPTNMAANFAVAELMLTGQISSSFCLGFQPFTNVQIGASGLINLTHDEHFTGPMSAIMINTYFYRCFLGCLTEFVTQLKANNLFGNTVIHISAEFSRAPRADSVGADHGYLGSGSTLISGMLPEMNVIGNVAKNSGSTTYPGTWGVAAPYPIDDFTRPIQQNDVARQISTMLNISDIVTNGMVLLENNSGSYTPRKLTGFTSGANNV